MHDGFVDFDLVLRDPSDPLRLYPAYDSGDHGHPSDEGYEAMAAVVDLSLLGAGPAETQPGWLSWLLYFFSLNR